MMKKILIGFFVFSIYGNSQNLIVNNSKELIIASQIASPGDVIVLNDGIYQGKIIFDQMSGKKKSPITVKAAEIGKAEIHDKIEIKGEYINIEGLSFVENGNLEILGKSIKVSQCIWDDSKSKKWLRILEGSSLIEIGYNTFQNKSYNSQYEKGCQLLQIVVLNQNERHHIHHNFFYNITEGSGNGFETLQLITYQNPFDPPPGHSNSIIEHNLFERANGEAEIISIKSNGNIIRRNVFKDCKGSLVLRHGDNNKVYGNFFSGTNEAKSGGIRIQGSGQLISNNYFQNLGSFGLGMVDCTPDDLYVRVSEAEVLFNTFVNCNNTFEIGINHSKHPNGTPPINCLIEGNIIYFDKSAQKQALIKFVKEDLPIDWRWINNISFGGLNYQVNGIRNVSPNFIFQNQWLLPTQNTPFTKNITTKNKSLIEKDLFGFRRNKKITLGAIQFFDSLQIRMIGNQNVGAYNLK